MQPLQTVTRATFWTVTPVGKVIFYYLAAVPILLFGYGVYTRFARYSRGPADPFARLDHLQARTRAASAPGEAALPTASPAASSRPAASPPSDSDAVTRQRPPASMSLVISQSIRSGGLTPVTRE